MQTILCPHNQSTLIIGPSASGKTSIIKDFLICPKNKNKSKHVFEYYPDNCYETLDVKRHIFMKMNSESSKVLADVSFNKNSMVAFDDSMYDITLFHSSQLKNINLLILSLCYPYDIVHYISNKFRYVILLPTIFTAYRLQCYHLYCKFLPINEFHAALDYICANKIALFIDVQKQKVYYYDHKKLPKIVLAVKKIEAAYFSYLQRKRLKAAIKIQHHVLEWLYTPIIGPMYKKIIMSFQSRLRDL